MKLNKAILWMTALLLLNPGCSIYKPDEYAKDKFGNYLNHFESCGPKALERAFALYDQKNGIVNKKKISREEISRSIQQGGISLREVLSLFHYDALMITTPYEMRAACKKYGYDMVSIDSLEKVDYKEDVVLVLVLGSLIDQEAHWLCIPYDKIVKNYFGENTRINQIYLLKKKS